MKTVRETIFRADNMHVCWSNVLTDQLGRYQFFKKYKIVKNLKKKKNDNKTDDYLCFKITKAYLQKKSLCNFFVQNIERTLLKYAPSILRPYRVLDIQNHTFLHWF